MKTKLILNEKVLLRDKTYTVIGIDDYSMNNSFGGQAHWISYTLLDNEKNKTWISFGAIKKYFIQWFEISKKEFLKESATPLNFELTGISNITFQGNPGHSTPLAELIWFNAKNKNYDFYLIERFLKTTKGISKPMESYYQGGKILKDFKP